MGLTPQRKILRVNLTDGACTVEEFDENLYRLYPGGKALAAYILLRETRPYTDPFSPDNPLILANGVLTGAPFSTATRFTAVSRSPLTGGFGESEAGGFWGPELKMAGYEAIILSGRAPQPVYLSIRDDHYELRNARALWGEEPEVVQDRIRQELGDRLIRILQIGMAGENRVRFAAIVNELRHFNGRCGMGAVMGSKNLKAIAVRGRGRYLDQASRPDDIAQLGRTLSKRVKEHPQSWDLQYKGTPGAVDGLQAAGILPTRNFHSGAFENVDKVKWAAYERELLTARKSCYACAVRCKREVRVDDRYHVSDHYGGPEYEAVDGFGPNCGIDDLQAIAKANELCNRLTLDAISTASTVSFAMECFEHGLITRDQTGGMELRFGNAQAMLQIIELIARREGIGDLLAEGTRRAASVIGGDAAYFAMQVKGQELPMHDPRGKVGLALGYAVSDSGAEHLNQAHDPLLQNSESISFKGGAPLGLVPLPALELSPLKVRNYAILENWSSMEKVVGLCFFGPVPRSFIQVDEVVNGLRAATGWDLTIADVLRFGERATNLARAFNVLNGLTRADDTLPDRLFQPLENGVLQGVGLDRGEFDEAMTELYRVKGWNPATAAPTRERLRELEIEWVADRLGI